MIELDNVDSKLIDSVSERQAILFDALSPSRLALAILPTEKCNFRCVYCYEDYYSGRMKVDIRDGIKNLIRIRMPDLDALSISWFGGEPFIAYDIVIDLMKMAHDCARDHGAQFSATATTNGYNLSRSRLLELEGFGLRLYQISLDGDREGHDQTRKRIDGAGTFDKIWKNLIEFNELCVSGKLNNSTIMLRIHAHHNNVQSINRLTDMIAENLDDRFFQIHVMPISNLGGSCDQSLKKFSRNSNEFIELSSIIHSKLTNFKRSMPENHNYVCYAGKANNYVIRANGRIAKCTVAFDDERNDIGQLMHDGSMQLYADRLSPWLNGLRTMRKDDLACPLGSVRKQVADAAEQSSVPAATPR